MSFLETAVCGHSNNTALVLVKSPVPRRSPIKTKKIKMLFKPRIPETMSAGFTHTVTHTDLRLDVVYQVAFLLLLSRKGKKKKRKIDVLESVCVLFLCGRG